MSKLVIVESPAKAKTIKKYLGGDYEVVASMGHVRDLPKARLCVDVKDNFKPKYAIIKGKEKLVSELKEAAAESETVYLATDPRPRGRGDFVAPRLHSRARRARDEPRDVQRDHKDRRHGGHGPPAHDRSEPCQRPAGARASSTALSATRSAPFLAKTIRRGLSAGRVQSVALRIIVDREEEIRKFKPEEYWSIDARLTAEGSRSIFGASFYGDPQRRDQDHEQGTGGRDPRGA